MKLEDINKKEWRDDLYVLNRSYTLGLNDGAEFNRVVFTGTKIYHGKPMLTFKMTHVKRALDEDVQLTINQSYLSYAIEEPMEDKENG